MESAGSNTSGSTNAVTGVAGNIAGNIAGTVAKTVAPLIPESVYGTMGKQFINIICDTLYHGSDELKLHPKQEILKIIEEQLKRGLSENVEQINKRMNEVIAEETRKYMQPFLSNNTISIYMMHDILTKHFGLFVDIIQNAKSSIHKTAVDDKVNAIMEQLTKPVLFFPKKTGGSGIPDSVIPDSVIHVDDITHNSKFTSTSSDQSDTNPKPSVPSASDSSFEKLAKESVSIFKEKMDKHVTGEEINDVVINGLQYHIEKPEGRQMFLRQIEPVLRSYVLEYTNKGQSLAILFSHLCSIEPIHSIMKNNLTDYVKNEVTATIACNNIKEAMNKHIAAVNPLNGIYKDMETYFTKPQIIEKMRDDSNKTICTGSQQLKNAITGNNEISAVLVSNIEEQKIRDYWKEYIKTKKLYQRDLTFDEYKEIIKKIRADWLKSIENKDLDQPVQSIDANKKNRSNTPQDTTSLPSVGVLSVAISRDGSKIVSGTIDGYIKLLDIEKNTKKRFITSRVNSVAFSPDNTKIVSGSSENIIELWDIANDEPIKTFEGHTDHVTSVAFSPDGKQIVSGSYDHTIKLWNTETGDVIQTFGGDNGIVYSVAFSPDGTKIVSGSTGKIESGSSENIIKLWDIANDEPIITFKGHTSRVTSVAFSPDGSKIVSGSYDKTIKLWNTETGELIQTFKGHTDHVNSVAFSPNRNQIVSGSSDKTIKLWDIAKDEPIQTFNIHTDRVNSVAFSPDGSKIISGSSDNTVKISDVDTEQAQKGGKTKRISKTKRKRRTFRKRNMTQRHL